MVSLVHWKQNYNMSLILLQELFLRQRLEIILHLFKSLHWLPVMQCCAFKTALLTFKIIHGLAPSYLCELVRYRSTARDLRSIDDIFLDVPKFKSCAGSRAFVVSAPKLWNSLPYDIRTCGSLTRFRSKLKTYLFREAFS